MLIVLGVLNFLGHWLCAIFFCQGSTLQDMFFQTIIIVTPAEKTSSPRVSLVNLYGQKYHNLRKINPGA